MSIIQEAQEKLINTWFIIGNMSKSDGGVFFICWWSVIN